MNKKRINNEFEKYKRVKNPDPNIIKFYEDLIEENYQGTISYKEKIWLVIKPDYPFCRPKLNEKVDPLIVEKFNEKYSVWDVSVPIYEMINFLSDD